MWPSGWLNQHMMLVADLCTPPPLACAQSPGPISSFPGVPLLESSGQAEMPYYHARCILQTQLVTKVIVRARLTDVIGCISAATKQRLWGCGIVVRGQVHVPILVAFLCHYRAIGS